MTKLGIYLTLTFCTLAACMGQKKADQQTFDVAASPLSGLHIHNMYGAVKVVATSSNTLTVHVERTLEAKSASRLAQAEQEIYFDTMWVDNELYFYMNHPDLKLKVEENGRGHYTNCDDYNWNKPSLSRNEVEYEFVLTLEVPAETDLFVSTHQGELTVDGMKGKLSAGNHHSSITISNQAGSTSAHTHHGDITLTLLKNPTEEEYFHTHHGDIKVIYATSLAADVSLTSRHGEFYTDFDWELLPPKISENNDNNETKYVVSSRGTHVKIGNGGPLQTFDTYHGDIFLLRQ